MDFIYEHIDRVIDFSSKHEILSDVIKWQSIQALDDYPFNDADTAIENLFREYGDIGYATAFECGSSIEDLISIVYKISNETDFFYEGIIDINADNNILLEMLSRFILHFLKDAIKENISKLFDKHVVYVLPCGSYLDSNLDKRMLLEYSESVHSFCDYSHLVVWLSENQDLKETNDFIILGN